VVVVTDIGFEVFFFLMCPLVSLDVPLWAGVIFSVLIGVCNVAMLFWVWRKISRNEQFVCRIADGIFSQVVPFARAGESFSIDIAQISKIERKSRNDSDEWYLCDNEGRRHQLTPN